MIDDMPKRLPHLHREKTRHGATVWYVRIGHGPRIRMRAETGSQEFLDDYRSAIAGIPPKSSMKGPEDDPRTLAWLAKQWRKSSDWCSKRPSTRRQRENILLHVLEKSGSVPFRAVRKEHIIDGRERRQNTPFAANNFIKTMRALFRWAVDSKLVETDPTEGVRFIKTRTEGFAPWTSVDVEKFRARWPLGTRERVALEILLNTGLRRGDAVRLGRQHVRDGVAMLRAEKTGVELFIPILPALAEALQHGPVGDLTFVCSAHGRAMGKESFGNWFKTACRAAGVDKSAHGLRKLAATIIADQGGSEHELQALFGWQTNDQSSVYTRNANKRKLAIQAANRLNTEQKKSRTL